MLIRCINNLKFSKNKNIPYKYKPRKKFLLHTLLILFALSSTSCGKYGKLKPQNNEDKTQFNKEQKQQKEQKRREQQKIENQLKSQELNRNQNEVDFYDNDFNF